MNNNIEIIPNTKECYTPLVAFESWRVAGLNHCDIVDIAHLNRVERHLETDEVFILTAGRASLIVERGSGVLDGPEETGFDVIPMEPNTVYNIKRGVYHHVVMEKDASIIIVENNDTTAENSEYKELDTVDSKKIKERTAGILGG